MKFVRKSIISCLMIIATMFCLVGCFDTTEKYTIQYNDHNGQQEIRVESERSYSIKGELPYKFGYEFTGLFSEEINGTQYVNKYGQSISIFTDNMDLTLYPQFTPKSYVLTFDYQGASVTGEEFITVDYDSALSSVPTGLVKQNYKFVGWFTKPNCKGVQVSNSNKVISLKNKITKEIYDMSDTATEITLYAGFEAVEYELSLYIGDTLETIMVKHGTNIKNVVTNTRVDNKAPITWTKVKNSNNIFTGSVYSEMVLYAVDFAPVIDFDTCGGDGVDSIVEYAGNNVTLPTATKENYSFDCWLDSDGNKYTNTTMPSKSIVLTAKWNAVINFDENGGTEVSNIAKNAGLSITLPTNITKKGYSFAGWYDENNNKVNISVMPEQSITLKAGWYKVVTEKVIIIANDVHYSEYIYPSEYNLKTVDLSSFLPANYVGLTVNIKGYFKMKCCCTGEHNITFGVYNNDYRSNLMIKKSFLSSSDYKEYTYEHSYSLTDDEITISTKASSYCDAYINDYYLEISFDDTTKIYI